MVPSHLKGKQLEVESNLHKADVAFAPLPNCVMSNIKTTRRVRTHLLGAVEAETRWMKAGRENGKRNKRRAHLCVRFGVPGTRWRCGRASCELVFKIKSRWGASQVLQLQQRPKGKKQHRKHFLKFKSRSYSLAVTVKTIDRPRSELQRWRLQSKLLLWRPVSVFPVVR